MLANNALFNSNIVPKTTPDISPQNRHPKCKLTKARVRESSCGGRVGSVEKFLFDNGTANFTLLPGNIRVLVKDGRHDYIFSIIFIWILAWLFKMRWGKEMKGKNIWECKRSSRMMSPPANAGAMRVSTKRHLTRCRPVLCAPSSPRLPASSSKINHEKIMKMKHDLYFVCCWKIFFFRNNGRFICFV